MNYKVKGIGLITVVVVGSVCLVGGAVGGYLYGRFSGGGDGFGLGSEGTALTLPQQQEGDTENPPQDSPVDLTDSADSPTEEVTEEPTPPTEPVTIPIVENLDTVEIVISGNGYLYRNTPVTLEAVKGIFQTLGDDYTIKITDKKASLKAYNDLTDLLEEMGMHYIEVIA